MERQLNTPPPEIDLKERINGESLVLIQARMGSERFAGKVLYPFRGEPALGHLLAAVLQVYLRENVIVVSSREEANDRLETFCRDRSVGIFRGDETNVAQRFRDVLECTKRPWAVRLSGDSPLLDHRIIERALSMALESGADLVSTAPGRRFPSGMNVEVIRRETFLAAYGHFSNPGHFEHVTTYFYENPRAFLILGVPPETEHPERYKFSFDTDEDRKKIERIFEALPGEHYRYSLRDKCRIYETLFAR